MSNHKRWKHISPKGTEEYAKTQLKLKAARSKRVEGMLEKSGIPKMNKSL